MKPLLEFYNFHLQLSNWHFFLLVFSTLMLSAAGYIINDYYDVNTDTVNHPDRVIVGKKISYRLTFNLYLLFNFIAILIGLYIASVIHIKLVGLAFLMVSGLLWFYSTNYKSQLILGNIMVAMFAGLVPLMVLLFELPLLNNFYKMQLWGLQINLNYIIWWLACYGIFAFMLTLIREIIKDTEDFEGDQAYGQQTLPVVSGTLAAKIVIISLLILTIGFLVYICFRFLFDPITLVYLISLIISPLLFVIFRIAEATSKRQYHQASLICKLVMLSGILYAFIAQYIITYNFK
jgi:4-hydroxybenzoate polyprenyltransferase